MHIRVFWENVYHDKAVANLVDNSGVHIRRYEIPVENLKEFIGEYFEHHSRPVPPPPYWSENSHIATLTYYLKMIDEALKEPDDAVKLANVKAVMKEFNTPVAVA